jgi:hypothetical protein
MIKLKTMWAREKFNTTFRKANRRVEIASIFDLKNIVAEYNQHVEELDGIRMVPGESEFLTTFKQELSAFYGAFLDDQLVSYCEVEGNDSFMAFHSRASVRVNGLSPQEFLDYNLVRDFSRRGVKILDRGFINEPRDGDSGLIEYKKKFGPIIPKVETNYDYVTTSKTAQRVYLDNLFGLVYGK